MKYLLDTHIVSYFYDQTAEGHRAVWKKIASLQDTDNVAISILTVFELEYGLANAPDDRRESVLAKVKQSQKDFQILPLFPQSARIFAFIKKATKDRHSMNKKSIHRHNVDLILAACCIFDDRTLVSADKIFGDIKAIEPTFRSENWLLA